MEKTGIVAVFPYFELQIRTFGQKYLSEKKIAHKIIYKRYNFAWNILETVLYDLCAKYCSVAKILSRKINVILRVFT